MTIAAEWAILTKFPGDARDFRVLASNGEGLDAQGYENLIRKWLTGEVPLEATPYNPRVPWYQFGVTADPLRQVVLRQEWTGYADYRNRPVLITTCLLLPFAELAQAGCGFRQMVGLFEQEEVRTYLTARVAEIAQGEERRNFEPLMIHLPEREECLKWARQAVEKVGYVVCEQAANALLRGPLGFEPGGEIMTWEERATYLDAALALLPYGLRADCPASLWTNSTSHAMRLYWGRSARPGHGRLMIPLRSNSSSVPGEHASYIKDLNLIQKSVPLDVVLTHLARQTAPRSFSGPLAQDVLEGLGRRIGLMYRTIQTTTTVSNAANQSARIVSNNVSQSTVPVPPGTVPKENPDGRAMERFIGWITEPRLKQNTPDVDAIIYGAVQTFSNAKKPVDFDYVRANAIEVLKAGKIVELFDKLLGAWKKLDSGTQPERGELFLQLLQTTLEQGEKEGLPIELADWIAQKLPDEFWYEWVNLIVNIVPTSSPEPLVECLRRKTGKKSEMIAVLQFAAGLRPHERLEDSLVNSAFSWRGIPLQYPIWLIQFAAVCGTLEKVFEPAGDWLRVRKQKLPPDAMNRMLANPLLNQRLTDKKARQILDELQGRF